MAGLRRWWGSVVVVVDQPGAQRGGALVLGRPGLGVEQFFGQDPLGALDLAVVSWGVGRVSWWREPARVRVNAPAR